MWYQAGDKFGYRNTPNGKIDNIVNTGLNVKVNRSSPKEDETEETLKSNNILAPAGEDDALASQMVKIDIKAVPKGIPDAQGDFVEDH